MAATVVGTGIRWLGLRVKPAVERRLLVLTPAVGLVVALLAIGYAQATGHPTSDVLYSGENAIGPLITHAADYSVGTLLLLLLCKGLAYSACLGSFRGGPIFPAMFLGAAGGIAMSRLPGLADRLRGGDGDRCPLRGDAGVPAGLGAARHAAADVGRPPGDSAGDRRRRGRLRRACRPGPPGPGGADRPRRATPDLTRRRGPAPTRPRRGPPCTARALYARRVSTDLPEEMAQVLAAYERHLVSERDLAPHTVRAYLGDIAGMLEQAVRLGHTGVATLDVGTLRSWLATQQTLGQARTTMARRATAVRVFTAWAQRTGPDGRPTRAPCWAPRRRTGRCRRRSGSTRRARCSRPRRCTPTTGARSGARDVAILELLYATGIRVGELCGLDVDDVDHERRVVRVFGKGRKERTVPFGVPAARALDAWLASRPAGSWPRPGAGAALFLGARGQAHRPARRARRSCTPGSRTCPAPPTSGRTGCGTPRPPTCSRAGPTCARPGAARARLAGHHADLHPRDHRPAAQGLPPGAPARLSGGSRRGAPRRGHAAHERAHRAAERAG